MRQNEALEKKTLGQKTEDRLMKYILDRPIQIGQTAHRALHPVPTCAGTHGRL